MARDSSKTIHRECSVKIVRLDNFSDIQYSRLILIRRAHIMKTTFSGVRAVAACVVDSSDKRNLAPWSQVFNKRRCLEHTVVHKCDLTAKFSCNFFTNLQTGKIKSSAVDCDRVMRDYLQLHLGFWIRITQSLQWNTNKLGLNLKPVMWHVNLKSFVPDFADFPIELEINRNYCIAAAAFFDVSWIGPI